MADTEYIDLLLFFEDSIDHPEDMRLVAVEQVPEVGVL
jgi:hypothetical protein